MTERKPSGSTFESWIDKQVREATERGEFENLRGAGEPIPGAGTPLDENWWLRGYLAREGVGGDVMLPASLRLRREVERLPQRLAEFDSESEVREECAELNARIVEWMRVPEGPMVPIAMVDTDEMVAKWRTEARRAPANPSRATDRSASTSPQARPATTGEPRRWWHRLTGR